MRKWQTLPTIAIALALQPGCGGTTQYDEDTSPSVTEVVSNLQTNGLTCETQRIIQSFDEQELERFGELVRKELTQDQFMQLVENREQGCDIASVEDDSKLGVSTQPITGQYVVEVIEEDNGYSGSWGGSMVLRDGWWYGNMCGPDQDYIVEFDRIPGAYSNRSSLRMVGLNSRGRCLLGFRGRHYASSRVYSDNDIRACIGNWAAWWCGSAPRSGDLWPYIR